MMKSRCRVVRHRLPGVDSVDELGPRLTAHVATCLTCQAEAARYRSLRRRMGELAGEIYPAPEELVPAVMAAIEAPEEEVGSTTLARRVAIAASAAGAFVAAGAGTIIVIGFRRSHNAA
jgi:hypothetical protein